jgi:hypothetical protein
VIAAAAGRCCVGLRGLLLPGRDGDMRRLHLLDAEGCDGRGNPLSGML